MNALPVAIAVVAALDLKPGEKVSKNHRKRMEAFLKLPPNAAGRARFVTGGTIVNSRPGVKRNAVCPFCDSGRKFKHCHKHVADASGPNAGKPISTENTEACNANRIRRLARG